MDKIGYFWYSEKQYELYRIMNTWPSFNDDFDIRSRHVYAKLEDGSVVEYTEWISTPFASSRWDDAKYLGKGKFHHMEGIIA